MNWDTLPTLIIEKIVYYAANSEYEANSQLTAYKSNRWLLSLEKFGRVSDRWKSAILTSRKLFSDERNQLVLDNQAYLFDMAETLISGGYFGLIRSLIIVDITCPYRVKRILDSVENAENYASLQEFEITIDSNWTLENVNSVMNILHRCPKITCIKIRLYDKYKCTQEWAVTLWELLLCTIHCNPLSKTISFVTDYDVDIGEMVDLEIDWSFITSYVHEGIGSIKELELELDPNVNEVPLGQGPLWCYLTDKVKIDRLTIVGFGGINRLKKHRLFLRGLKADCLKVQIYGFDSYNITEPEKKWFRSFKTMHITDDIKKLPAIIDTMKTIQHTNAHFVIEDANNLFYETFRDNTAQAKRFIELAIEVLPKSIFKTMIFPKPNGYHSFDETVFVCDHTLSQTWHQFTDKYIRIVSLSLKL